ncbi:SWI/SNF complex component SNF12 homolog [Coffea arabica]|uniref:SWI/SNF complex component SNF12 homolog n=1 Tax=Coffea arabica TaxID=13443 RepID=A0ABM4V6K7_COFAR
MQVSMNHKNNHDQTAVPHLPTEQPQRQGGGPQFPGNFQLSERLQAQGLGHALAAHAQLENSATANAAAVSSPGPSTPATSAGSSRRTPSHKPPSRPSGGVSSGGHGQGATASPLKTMELAPAVRRRKRKLPEKEIPHKAASSLPESALYAQLLELESRIDALLARKKIEIADTLKNPMRIQKMLRIYVFNTFANQEGAHTDSKNADPPSWSLKICGRILEDGADPAALGSLNISSSPYPKFSSFIRKMTVYLDQNLYPDNHVILWENSRSPALHEGFEVKRKGDKEFTAIVRLEMDFVPEKFRLSPALQEVLGVEVETRPRTIAALWHYIKTRKLQIPGDTSSFVCDPPLRKVFGEENLKFAVVSQKIIQHLTSLKPIHLEHKIKLSGNCPAGNTCYDVPVDVPILLEREMSSFLTDLERNKEVDAFDEAISAAIRKIHEHYQRQAFFLGFSHSPAEFINGLLASQARDLKLLGADTSHNAENERRSEFYNQTWVEDAVIRYLNRKPSFSAEPRNK